MTEYRTCCRGDFAIIVVFRYFSTETYALELRLLELEADDGQREEEGHRKGELEGNLQVAGAAVSGAVVAGEGDVLEGRARAKRKVRIWFLICASQ